MLHFKFYEDNGILKLNLPLFLPIVSLFIAAAVSLAMFVPVGGSGDGSGIAPAIIVISLLSALYNEIWLFDRDNRQIIHKVGLRFFYFSRRYSMDNVNEVVIIASTTPWQQKKEFDSDQQSGHAVSGLNLKRRKPFIQRIAILLEDGKELTVEMYKRRDESLVIERAKKIADYCGVTVRQ